MLDKKKAILKKVLTSAEAKQKKSGGESKFGYKPPVKPSHSNPLYNPMQKWVSMGSGDNIVYNTPDGKKPGSIDSKIGTPPVAKSVPVGTPPDNSRKMPSPKIGTTPDISRQAPSPKISKTDELKRGKLRDLLILRKLQQRKK